MYRRMWHKIPDSSEKYVFWSSNFFRCCTVWCLYLKGGLEYCATDTLGVDNLNGATQILWEWYLVSLAGCTWAVIDVKI